MRKALPLAVLITASLGLAGCMASAPDEPALSLHATASSGGGVVIYRPAGSSRPATAPGEGAAGTGSVALRPSSGADFEDRVRREPAYRIAPSDGSARAADRAAAVAQAAAERQARLRTATVQQDAELIETRENVTLTEARSRRALAEATLRRQGVLAEQRRGAIRRLEGRPRLAPSLAERTATLQSELQAAGRPDFDRTRPRTRVRSGTPTYRGALP
ncbi:MAG: hypothetical protein AAF371_16485 [Pseudomonadota bacterium]